MFKKILIAIIKWFVQTFTLGLKQYYIQKKQFIMEQLFKKSIIKTAKLLIRAVENDEFEEFGQN